MADDSKTLSPQAHVIHLSNRQLFYHDTSIYFVRHFNLIFPIFTHEV